MAKEGQASAQESPVAKSLILRWRNTQWVFPLPMAREYDSG